MRCNLTLLLGLVGLGERLYKARAKRPSRPTAFFFACLARACRPPTTRCNHLPKSGYALTDRAGRGL